MKPRVSIVHQATGVGPILKDFSRQQFNSLFMKKTIIITECPEQQGWNKNTELCMDVKTYLRSDSRMKAGKNYQGVLRRDVECEEFHYNEHMTFVETVNQQRVKRNPRIFEGKYITVTRWADGSYHPNFRPVKMDAGFSPERYAAGVATELMWALEGLVGE